MHLISFMMNHTDYMSTYEIPSERLLTIPSQKTIFSKREGKNRLWHRTYIIIEHLHDNEIMLTLPISIHYLDENFLTFEILHK